MTDTVFLLPGLLCDASVWTQQQRAFGTRYDIRIPNFYGFDSLTKMAESVLDAAPKHFAVAGHSMGGRVALEIFRLAPERIERIALLDTGVHPAAEGEKEKRQILIDVAKNEGMKALAARWIPPMLHPERAGDSGLLKPLTEMVCRATPEIYERQVHALLMRRDATEQLRALSCPTLIACGRQDQWSTLAQHEAMAKEQPKAVLEVIEDSGHMVSVEAPEATAAVLLRWLNAKA